MECVRHCKAAAAAAVTRASTLIALINIDVVVGPGCTVQDAPVDSRRAAAVVRSLKHITWPAPKQPAPARHAVQQRLLHKEGSLRGLVLCCLSAMMLAPETFSH